MGKRTSIAVFGCHSLVGTALIDKLRQNDLYDLIAAELSKVEFSDIKSVCSFFHKKKPDYCIIAPIKEGGIEANIRFPADLIYRNLAAQTNIIHAAWQTNVKKLIYFASSCAYPKNCLQPIKEEHLLTGPLETTSESYSVAKISGIQMCNAYNLQYNTRFISAMSATAYGPKDSFDKNMSHVIPALLRKFHEAKIKNMPYVSIWGTGNPLREFIYIDDLVEAVLFLLAQETIEGVVNIGVGVDISIAKLAQLIKKITGFKGQIKFDIQKPEGVLRKLLDNTKLKYLGWKPRMSLEAGIKKTYQWYIKNY